MLVLETLNDYNFANIRISIDDQTVISDDTTSPEPEVPDFNLLIPTVQDVGVTNTMELYYPGEPNRYLLAHGNPNAAKFGFGPDLIYDILNTPNSQVGIYTVNLRGPSATAANVICLARYRVESNVAYTDINGNPYYVTEDGQLTTEPTGNTPVVRDVLRLRFDLQSAEGIRTWPDLFKYIDTLYSAEEDDAGYRTIPWFAVMYRGVSSYGNNSYFTMTPSRAEYDGNIYYTVRLFNGQSTQTSDPNFSMDRDAGVNYNTSYFIENRFNETFTSYRFVMSSMAEELEELINKYLYTVDDYLNGKMATPSQVFAEVDAFSLNTFGIQIDMDSINTQVNNAFQFTGGSDGTGTADELYEAFFKGEIITDINSVLRYHINYVPDIGYSETAKRAMVDWASKRTRMTVTTIMLGGQESLSSALIDHQANWYTTNPIVRQLAKAQSPMMYNSFIRRTITYPATYFDTMALMDHFNNWSNYYQPFAGAFARWTGFIEDTIIYPTETVDSVNALYTNRINTVMKDADPGAYLAEQMMNTEFTSDQTELNNAFLISNMLYDLVDLVHVNHFKFNEAEEVRIFNEAVNELINNKYAEFSASLEVEVYREGTVGLAKSRNRIRVTIDMRDINKFTDVDLILTDA